MGGKKKHSRNNRRGGNPKPKQGGDPDFIQKVLEEGNFQLESYYGAQGLWNHRFDTNTNELVPCKNDEERQAERLAWKAATGRILPASFRINKDVSSVLKEHLEGELRALLKDQPDIKVHKLPFLPNGYQLDTDNVSLKKESSLKPLRTWMQLQSECGNITRQETVSMIPPVVLNPQPTDALLDMCAAPGSKTSQLLEELSAEGGSIVANDVSIQRAYLLTTQLKRILHRKPFAAITAGPAQRIPGAVGQFDRILADVPCSGDGTSRKNIDIWQKWSQMGAFALHPLQEMIAWKGAAHLLKVGGYLVYSTCSQNPIENEAVVASLLRKAEGQLELVDCPLQGFRTRPGWSSWKVLCQPKTKREIKNQANRSNAKMQARRKEFELDSSKVGEDTEEVDAQPSPSFVEISDKETIEVTENKIPARKYAPESMEDESTLNLALEAGFSNYEAYDDLPEILKGRVRKSCFPPTSEEAANFHLERCIRVLAHDNDTGGFFVALLRKRGPMGRNDRESLKDGTPETKRQKVDDDSEDGKTAPFDDDAMKSGGNNRHFMKPSAESIDAFEPAPQDTMDSIVSFYGLDSAFRRDLFMTRSSKGGKNIYYIAEPIKNYIDNGLQERVNLVNTGLKSFVRKQKEDPGCSYRISQEGVHFIANHMTKRKVIIEKEDFEKCLTTEQTPITIFSEEFQQEARAISSGSFVAVLKGYEDSTERKMVLAMWRSKGDNVTSLVAKSEFDYIRSMLKEIEKEQELIRKTI